MLKPIVEFLSKTLNMDSEEVAGLLKTDENGELVDKEAITKLFEKDKSRIKEVQTTYHDNGHKKGKKDALEVFEKELATTFEFENSEKLQGTDLVKAILEKKAPQADPKDKGKELTVEELKKNPLFLDLESKWKKQMEEIQKAKDDELKQVKEEFSYKETLTVVEKKALALIDELNPVFPTEDPKKLANLKKDLVNKLLSNKYQLNGEDIIALKEDGSRIEDEHGHTVNFNDLVKGTVTSYYDLKKAEDRSSAGAGSQGSQGGQGGGKGWNGKTPASEQEYVTLLGDKNISNDDKLKIKQAYHSQQTA